jgi:CelD/BcsL family acetyltransferase involved in cellulose biosynthesis
MGYAGSIRDCYAYLATRWSVNMIAEDLDWQEARARWSSAWAALSSEGRYHLSLSPGWIQASATAAGRFQDLRVLVCREGDRLVGVVPYLVHCERIWGIRMAVAEFATNLMSYHHQIVAPARETEVLSMFLDRGPWDIAVLNGVVADSPTAAAVSAVAAHDASNVLRYTSEASPYLPINGSWTDYLATRTANFRANLKRKEKRLQKAGILEEHWFRKPAEVPELYQCMLDVEAASWKAKQGLAVSDREDEQRYYQALLPFLATSGALYANALYLDGTPVAYHLCCAHAGTVGNLKTSFRKDHAALSPGAVVIARAIQRAFEDGFREFDFHGGEQYHKLLWTGRLRRHDSYYLYSRRLRSRALALGKKAAHVVKGWMHDAGTPDDDPTLRPGDVATRRALARVTRLGPTRLFAGDRWWPTAQLAVVVRAITALMSLKIRRL